ncbi:hypothetical protein CLOM_g12227 [Closterium sp. NIES-68]|nr:hypothetical protein CLOM_g12227 [Closterium sp. NIES-68]
MDVRSAEILPPWQPTPPDVSVAGWSRGPPPLVAPASFGERATAPFSTPLFLPTTPCLSATPLPASPPARPSTPALIAADIPLRLDFLCQCPHTLPTLLFLSLPCHPPQHPSPPPHTLVLQSLEVLLGLVGGQAEQGRGEGAQGGGGGGEGGCGSAFGDVEMEEAEGWYPGEGAADAGAHADAAGADGSAAGGAAGTGDVAAAGADGRLRSGGVKCEEQWQVRVGAVEMDDNMEDAFDGDAAAAAAAAGGDDAAGGGGGGAGSASGGDGKLAMLCDAFPSFDRTVVAAFLESLDGDTEAAADALLVQETAAKAASSSAPPPTAAATTARAAALAAGGNAGRRLEERKEGVGYGKNGEVQGGANGGRAEIGGLGGAGRGEGRGERGRGGVDAGVGGGGVSRRKEGVDRDDPAKGGDVAERAVLEQLLLMYPRVDRDSLVQVLRACGGSLSDTCSFLDSSEVAASSTPSYPIASRSSSVHKAGQRRQEEVPLWEWRARKRAAERAAAAALAAGGGGGAGDGSGAGGGGHGDRDDYAILTDASNRSRASDAGPLPYASRNRFSPLDTDSLDVPRAAAGVDARTSAAATTAAAAIASAIGTTSPAAVSARAGAPGGAGPASPPGSSSSCYRRHREAAFDKKRMMQYYFREASAAWGRGERQRAAALANKGHEYRKEYQELMQAASQRIFRENNERLGNNMDVDLHNLHVDEALQHLQLHLTLLKNLPTLSSITVITGRGKHSSDGHAKIKPAVHRYLQERGVSWQEQNAGSIRITRYNLPPEPFHR